jgi:hypothetical protein
MSNFNRGLGQLNHRLARVFHLDLERFWLDRFRR